MSDTPLDGTVPVTAVLWDIDGTLLTSRAVGASFLDAVHTVTGLRPDPRGIDFGGRIDPEIGVLLLAAVDGDPAVLDDVLAEYRRLVAERADEIRGAVVPLAGVSAVLGELHTAGVVQTVLTGKLESVGLFKLEAANLVPPVRPDLGGFGDSAGDRAGVGRVALARLAAQGWTGTPDSCWIVGDTPRDLACARAIGVRCLLVATGRYDLAALSALDADLVLPDLSDVGALLTTWAARPRKSR